MIPGVSRSGATILGAMSLGIDRKTAAEFSFFLAVPTLTGATVLQLFKHWDEIPAGQLHWIGLGSIVSFVVAWVVVKGFCRSSPGSASRRSAGTGSSPARRRWCSGLADALIYLAFSLG